MGSNFVQENQPYPPFGRLPRLGRLIPLICFAKGKQANQPSAEEMLFPPGIFILTALLSAAFAAPFLAEAGFKRNKEKISNLICFGPFVILSKPSLPGQGQDRPTALLYDPGRLVLAALQQNQKKECVVLAGSHSFFLLYIFIPYVISGRGLRGRFPGPLCRRRWG